MIDSVINYLDVQLLAGVPFLQQQYGLVDWLWSDGKRYPGKYTGAGDWKHINIEAHKGVTYHRLTEAITYRSADEDPYACAGDLEVTVPMRMVVAFDRNVRTQQNDDEFTVVKMAGFIQKIMYSRNMTSVAASEGYGRISVTNTRIETDPQKAWTAEWEGVPFKLTGTWALMYIDYTIEATVPVDCLPDFACEVEC